MGIYQVVIAARFHRFHELRGHRHRNIKVSQNISFGFGIDEFHNIRMVDTQYRHVRPPPHPALFDDIGRCIKCTHERHRAAGYPAGRTDAVAFRTQAGE